MWTLVPQQLWKCEFVSLRVENGLAINAERRHLEYWKRNRRTLYIKLIP